MTEQRLITGMRYVCLGVLLIVVGHTLAHGEWRHIFTMVCSAALVMAWPSRKVKSDE